MNPDQPSREQIEARLTALLLGELPAAEAELLRWTISQDPELQKLYDQLKLTVGFVREAMKNPTGAPVDRETPLKLAQERRQKLLAHFKSARPKPPEELFWLRRIEFPSMRSLAIAAIIIFVICGIAAISIPNFVKARATSQSNAIINNLRQIEAAKNEWALEQKKSPDAVPTPNDLTPYLAGGTMHSVAGENYVLGRVSEPTVAEINGKRMTATPDQFLSFGTDQSATHSERDARTMNGQWALENRQAPTLQNSLGVNPQEPKVPPQPAPIALPNTESSQNEQNTTGVYSENVVGYVNISHFGTAAAGSKAFSEPTPMEADGVPPAPAPKSEPAPPENTQTVSTTAPFTPPQPAGREGPSGSTFNDESNAIAANNSFGIENGIRSFGGSGGVGGPVGSVGGAVSKNDFIARNDFIATNGILTDQDRNVGSLATRESPNANTVHENGMKNGIVENPNANTPIIISPDTGLPANAPAAPTVVTALPELSSAATLSLASRPQQQSVPVVGKEQERIRTIHETPETLRQAYVPVTPPADITPVEESAQPPLMTRESQNANSVAENSEQMQPVATGPGPASPPPGLAGAERRERVGLPPQPQRRFQAMLSNADSNEVQAVLPEAFASRLQSAESPASSAASTPTEQPQQPPLIARESQNANSGAENSDQMQPSSLSDNKMASDIEKLKIERQEEEAQIQRDHPSTPPPVKASVPQPEVLTSDNAFSTFSMNVSDVSFKLAMASLEKGQMPDPASIRSEEFINAFDYHDPEPLQGEPLAFLSERAADPFAHERDVLRFSIKAAAAGRQTGRALNLVLLLDTSGSMERADRVAIIREALRVLASQLQPQDVVSVVTFARTARLWADGISGNDAGATLDKVGSITPEGGTNLEEAMRLAYETALRHFIAGGMNRVVLLTDGAANLGNVDPQALTQKVDLERRQGIALDCFGIGWDDYNDDLLEQLSSNGDGRYAFINSPGEAATDFAAKLAGALQVAAEDVKVQVEFNPNRVTAWRQIGYAKHQLTKEQFRDNSVAAGAIASREAGNALYVIETNPDGQGPIATVRVRYRVPGTQDVRERSWLVDYTGPAPDLAQSSPPMRLAVTAAEISEWMADSPFAQDVTPDDLLNYLSDVPQYYGTDERPKQLEWLIREAKSVSGK